MEWLCFTLIVDVRVFVLGGRAFENSFYSQKKKTIRMFYFLILITNAIKIAIKNWFIIGSWIQLTNGIVLSISVVNVSNHS